MPDALPRAALRRALLRWYDACARDLPWRGTRDPYRVWLSEIMLQQTQVETVRPYYERFLAAFPVLERLATADLADVLRLWQGLGYYSRARNLHRAARVVHGERRGRWPTTVEGWLSLPGVGRYSAGAIASIAQRLRAPAVDGNVRRVLARLAALDARSGSLELEARAWELAGALLDPRRPGDFNQALMELGARVCRPRAPACAACPLASFCHARRLGDPLRFPTPVSRAAVRKVEAVAAAIVDRGRVLLVQRPPRGLLGGMWGLPAAEIRPEDAGSADAPMPPAMRRALRAALAADLGLTITVGGRLGVVEHVFTHRRLRLHILACRTHDGCRPNGLGRRVGPAELADVALSRLDQKALAFVPINGGRGRRPGTFTLPAGISGKVRRQGP